MRKIVLFWSLLFLFTCAAIAGQSLPSEPGEAGKGPIKEPVYEPPRVYSFSNGKVVFKEFFKGQTITRIEFFDPDSGVLLYGASLKDGRLVGKREGSAVDEDRDSFDDSGSIVSHKYFTHSGKTILVTREYDGELVEYKALEVGTNNPLTVSIDLKKGKIRSARRMFLLNNEFVDFKRNYEPDTYEELYFHNDGSRTFREYKFGILKREAHRVPAEGGGNLTTKRAYYLRGKLAFSMKSKFKGNVEEEVTIYDDENKLIGKANSGIGEILYLKEEDVKGRKVLKVIRIGQDGLKKVEAVKFEEE